MMESSTKEEGATTAARKGGCQITQDQVPAVEEPQYPTGLRLFSILVPLGICTFLIALVMLS